MRAQAEEDSAAHCAREYRGAVRSGDHSSLVRSASLIAAQRRPTNRKIDDLIKNTLRRQLLTTGLGSVKNGNLFEPAKARSSSGLMPKTTVLAAVRRANQNHRKKYRMFRIAR